MKLANCTKASIYGVYDLNQMYICDAAVSRIEDKSLTLTFDEAKADILRSEVYVTFYDRILGLATYYCKLSNYKEFLSSPSVYSSHVLCTLEKEISVIQRRRDIKVAINIETILTFTNDKDVIVDASAVLKDISAGGLFFTSRYPFQVGQLFSFSFRSSVPTLRLSGTILRIQAPDEYNPELPANSNIFGYGCCFTNLSPYTESLIRNFVYQKDIEQRKNRVESID